jgi:hypothetical protein
LYITGTAFFSVSDEFITTSFMATSENESTGFKKRRTNTNIIVKFRIPLIV